MCGIAGVLRFDGAAAGPELLRRMTDVLAHRGPDGEGTYLSGPLGLGHRRLAIIDLSTAGRQPMANEDGSVWVTFNGEIYNFAEIRRTLAARGHAFRSATDTEVLLHAYEEWGVDCLHRLNGMFAFGLWDERRRGLWLVRDRLGIKPLFYSHRADRLLFGSEIKALLCDSDLDRTLDYEALSYYLALNYTPAPHTLFRHIRQLLPGHYLWIDESGSLRDVEYWDLRYREGDDRGEQAYRNEFVALLEDAVRMRLVSDVPFGAFLSGGVDSSSVAYWMSRHLAEPVKTFSIGFGQPTFDELEYARLAARTIAAEHHERIVTADAAAVLPKLVWHAEEPTADSSMVAFYYLAQMAREHVTMALSGDGADEILAGYETYQAYYVHRLFACLPKWLQREVIAPLLRAFPVSDTKVNWGCKLGRFAEGLGRTAEDAHATRRMIFDADARAQLLTPSVLQSGGRADVVDLYRLVFSRSAARHPLDRMLYVDTRFYLPNDMLVKVDRMSMAHGLEVRVPFLDYRLVEFAATVPPRLKLKHFWQKKFLLKASMAGKLPRQVLWRKKEGFNVPSAVWIKHGLKPFVMDHLSSSQLREMEILNPGYVAHLLQQHFSGKADHSHLIWCLLTLVVWWQQFVKRSSLTTAR
jgi:asparagine synthase (glutamine-hydrolysing)